MADFPNEIGSTSSLNRDISAENSVELRVPGDTHVDAEQHWEMNYHEAAIFLEVCSMSYIGTVCMIIVCKAVENNRFLFHQEGENNEKFDSHPHNSEALPAYLLVHNGWYYGLDLMTSLILLILAGVEEPALPLFSVSFLSP